jgi:3-phenylpropionate/cinnamic acid dioxygenase small subunit
MTEPAYAEAAGWLFEEAALLDRRDFHGWLTRLAPDLRYTMPVRVTVDRNSGDGVSSVHHHFDESYGSLSLRVARVSDATQYAEDPPSRVRRFVTNIRVQDVGGDELVAENYLLLLRSRFDLPTVDTISAERRDTLRRVAGGLQLASREIIVDQATIGTMNLAIFL